MKAVNCCSAFLPGLQGCSKHYMYCKSCRWNQDISVSYVVACSKCCFLLFVCFFAFNDSFILNSSVAHVFLRVTFRQFSVTYRIESMCSEESSIYILTGPSPCSQLMIHIVFSGCLDIQIKLACEVVGVSQRHQENENIMAKFIQ